MADRIVGRYKLNKTTFCAFGQLNGKELKTHLNCCLPLSMALQVCKVCPSSHQKNVKALQNLGLTITSGGCEYL